MTREIWVDVTGRAVVVGLLVGCLDSGLLLREFLLSSLLKLLNLGLSLGPSEGLTLFLGPPLGLRPRLRLDLTLGLVPGALVENLDGAGGGARVEETAGDFCSKKVFGVKGLGEKGLLVGLGLCEKGLLVGLGLCEKGLLEGDWLGEKG